MYTIKSVLDDIASDYKRFVELESASQNRYISFLNVVLLCGGFYVAAGYRIKRWFQVKAEKSGKARIFWKIPGSLYIKLYQFLCLTLLKVQMPNSADIGSGLYISSGGNVIIGLTSAGKNLTVHRNVTIGMDLGRSFVAPTFGDDVCIHENCVVTSNSIGNSVTVLANSILTKNVTDNIVLGGNPARLRKDIDPEKASIVEKDYKFSDLSTLELIKSDIDRYMLRKSSEGKSWISMLSKPGLQVTVVHRLGVSISRNIKKPLMLPFMILAFPIQKVMLYIVRLLYGIKISKDVSIGKGFRLGHFGGIEIEKCVIGDFCNVEQHVVIKSVNSDSYPVIGDKVWIGSNAAIFGNVNIGSNSTISACSYVTGDIQEGDLVAGNPARVVAKNYDNTNLL